MTLPRSALIRDVAGLQARQFDVVIVGGGINGAYCLLDAVSRGLSAALIESHDFACATSANSAKVAHSGVRYLQHADFNRMHSSAKERSALFINAPHLMKHIPVLMPVRGHGIKGRETVRLYTAIYDWLTRQERRSHDPARCVPNSQMLSAKDTLAACPIVPEERLSGGAVWPEGLVTNTERLVIGLLRAAAERGALVCNRVRAEEIVRDADGGLQGIRATDALSTNTLTLRTTAIVDATGPLSGWSGAKTTVPYARAFGLVTKSLSDAHVLAFPAPPTYHDKDALIDRGESLQFAVPWKGKSILGTMHLPLEGPAEEAAISAEELDAYLASVNTALPDASLTRNDIYRVFWGLLPTDKPGSPNPEKQGQVIDHGRTDDLPGLFTIAGVKLTEARALAERTLDIVCRSVGTNKASATSKLPIWGGDIELLEPFRKEAERVMDALPQAARSRLIEHYGTGFQEVIRFAVKSGPLTFISGTYVLKQEVRYAIIHEQAQFLADVVLRRTDLGSSSLPSAAALEEAARLMGQELGWSESRMREEIAAVESRSNYAGAGLGDSIRAG